MNDYLDYLFPVDLTTLRTQHLHRWVDSEELSPALRLRIGDELDRRLHDLDVRVRTPIAPPSAEDMDAMWEDELATRETREQDWRESL